MNKKSKSLSHTPPTSFENGHQRLMSWPSVTMHLSFQTLHYTEAAYISFADVYMTAYYIGEIFTYYSSIKAF